MINHLFSIHLSPFKLLLLQELSLIKTNVVGDLFNLICTPRQSLSVENEKPPLHPGVIEWHSFSFFPSGFNKGIYYVCGILYFRGKRRNTNRLVNFLCP